MTRHDQRGAALVELALCLMLLMLIVFGITEFGRAMYVKNSLTQAAREGARLAAVSSSSLVTSGSEDRIRDRVRNAFTGGGTISISITYSPALTGGRMTANVTEVTVTVSQNFETLVPRLIPQLNNITLNGQSTMVFE